MKVATYILIAVMWLGALYIAIKSAPEERRVDCSLAEFHPDFTPAMRKACRERRSIKV
jgi:hypothetical protein